MRYHIGSVTTSLTDAVRAAIEGAPCSLRALARAAKVPHVTLSHIVNGHREATADVARKVADALMVWSCDTNRAAVHIRRHLKTGG